MKQPCARALVPPCSIYSTDHRHQHHKKQHRCASFASELNAKNCSMHDSVHMHRGSLEPRLRFSAQIFNSNFFEFTNVAATVAASCSVLPRCIVSELQYASPGGFQLFLTGLYLRRVAVCCLRQCACGSTGNAYCLFNTAQRCQLAQGCLHTIRLFCLLTSRKVLCCATRSLQRSLAYDQLTTDY